MPQHKCHTQDNKPQNLALLRVDLMAHQRDQGTGLAPQKAVQRVVQTRLDWQMEQWMAAETRLVHWRVQLKVGQRGWAPQKEQQRVVGTLWAHWREPQRGSGTGLAPQKAVQRVVQTRLDWQMEQWMAAETR